jgi:hypothetical protein
MVAGALSLLSLLTVCFSGLTAVSTKSSWDLVAGPAAA